MHAPQALSWRGSVAPRGNDADSKPARSRGRDPVRGRGGRASATRAADPYKIHVILVGALRKVGSRATAAHVKEHIESQTSFPGINGIYDFKAVPQRGSTLKNALVTRWERSANTWIVVSQPTGTPLQK